MTRRLLLALLILLAAPQPAGEPPIVACTTDADCAAKNPWLCGGPYEPECQGGNR